MVYFNNSLSRRKPFLCTFRLHKKANSERSQKSFFPCDTLIPQDIAMSNMDYRGFHKLGTNHSGRSFNCEDKRYLMQLEVPNEFR